jgi:hypothetical protein
MNSQTKRTIDEVLDEFLREQEGRLSGATYAKYQNIVGLLKAYLERYWPGHEGREYDRVTKAGGTYCGTFGPEEIPDAYGGFLDYFMPRKVLCGAGTLRAAGTVTKKLAKWLVEKGYVDEAEAAVEQARTATKALPSASKALDVLSDFLDEHAPDDYTGEIEDHFWVSRVEGARIWLEPLTAGTKVVGPLPVPKEAAARLQVGWDIGGVVGKTPRGWRLVEVWNVSP